MSKIALIDLDGTVADYDAALTSAMKSIQAPHEEPFVSGRKYEEEHIRNRVRLIRSRPDFWLNLPKLELGFEIVDELKWVGFNLHVLTKGPESNPRAWSEKVSWAQKHLPDAAVTISSDKSLVYGRVLVDDWPDYFLKWLTVRPRGLVVCVAHPWNEHVDHPNVLRYDGNNRKELVQKLTAAYERESGK